MFLMFCIWPFFVYLYYAQYMLRADVCLCVRCMHIINKIRCGRWSLFSLVDAYGSREKANHFGLLSNRFVCNAYKNVNHLTFFG